MSKEEFCVDWSKLRLDDDKPCKVEFTCEGGIWHCQREELTSKITALVELVKSQREALKKYVRTFRAVEKQMTLRPEWWQEVWHKQMNGLLEDAPLALSSPLPECVRELFKEGE